MIRVVFMDGREAEVTPAVFEQLLAEGRVRCFLRQNGWVDPREDPIRRRLVQFIGLPERRESIQRLLTSDRPLPLNPDAESIDPL